MLEGKVIDELGHDINKVLDTLHAQKSLRVPSDLHAQPYKIKFESIARNCKPDKINEVWRYGAQFDLPHNDAAIEQKLVEINQWIASNLI